MAHLMRTLLISNGEAASNAAMVEELQQSQTLQSPECVKAFLAVDRGFFWVEGGGPTAYADTPLRHGRFHQSAPHIYARALEALMPLRPGMSFLNIGSGTGYFSTLVSELLGERSINDGIDIWPETLAHAEDRCRRLGKSGMNFVQGNVYQLDVNVSMRYDRIYIGACANQRATYLYELLELGGILVAPFQAGPVQHLRKVVRESDTRFRVETLNSVHFATLVEPAATPPAAPSEELLEGSAGELGSRAPVLGLPGVAFSFALRQQPWTPERCWAYPAAFRSVVATVVRGRARDPHLLCLPPEVWVRHVLPWCSKLWFELGPTVPPAAATSAPLRALSALASAGETVKRALCARARQASGAATPPRSIASSESTGAGLELGSPGGNHHDLLLGGHGGEEAWPSESSGGTEAWAAEAGPGLRPREAAAATRGPAAAAGEEEEDAGLLAAGLLEGPHSAEAGGHAGPTRRSFWRCVGRCCQAAPTESLRTAAKRCAALRSLEVWQLFGAPGRGGGGAGAGGAPSSGPAAPCL